MALKRSNLKLDSPVNNFATLNPLHDNKPANTTPLSEGNLKYLTSTGSAFHTVAATMALRGKHYWEGYVGGGALNMFGIIGKKGLQPASNLNQGFPGYYSHGYSFYGNRTKLYNNNAEVASGLTACVAGDIVSFCFDANTGGLWYAVNGVWQKSGNPSNGKNPLVTVADDLYAPTISNVDGFYTVFNFGQNPTFSGEKTDSGRHSDANGRGEFYYKPPWGALALCSANIPEMEEKPNQNFTPVLWTGQTNGDAYEDGKVTTGFQPDLVWVKSRNADLAGLMYDSVRGATKYLQVNSNNGEGTGSDSLTDFLDSGFSVGADTSTTGVNKDSDTTYVAWCWKAGGAPADNKMMKDGEEFDIPTAGNIVPSKMSVNTKKGFSIVTWTGDGSNGGSTVPHGLDRAPEFMITKNIDGWNDSQDWNDWPVYHKSIRSGSANFISNALWLHDTRKAEDNMGGWHHDPTDEVFTPHSTGYSNVSQKTYIAYCWHSVPGYSAFGSYTATDSADGPFVYTGFKPAFLMVKVTNLAGDSWVMLDSSREEGIALYADKATDESSSDARNDRPVPVDFLSNGFRFKCPFSEVNGGSGGTNNELIYMAFAEKPPATVPEKVKYKVSSEPRHSFLFDGENYLKGKWGHLGYQFSYHDTMSSKFTISFWIKITEQNGGYIPIIRWGDSTSSNKDYTFLGFNDQPKNNIIMNSKVSSVVIDVESTAHTPINSWNHVMWTGEGKVNADSKFFLNGKETDLSYNTGGSSSGMQRIDNAGRFYMGLGPGTAYGNQFLLSDFYLVESMRCTPEDFCKYENGKLVPKTFDNIPQNTYGMHLDFHPSNMEYDSSGNLTLVKDSSGNGNHLTVND